MAALRNYSHVATPAHLSHLRCLIELYCARCAFPAPPGPPSHTGTVPHPLYLPELYYAGYTLAAPPLPRVRDHGQSPRGRATNHPPPARLASAHERAWQLGRRPLPVRAMLHTFR